MNWYRVWLSNGHEARSIEISGRDEADALGNAERYIVEHGLDREYLPWFVAYNGPELITST